MLFEGKPVGTPDASTFWRIVEEYKVTVSQPLVGPNIADCSHQIDHVHCTNSPPRNPP